MGTGKILLGVLAGVTAGALMGILFAPDRGSETRRKVVKKGKDLVGDVEETLKGFMTEVTEKFESAIKNAKEMVDKEPKGVNIDE
jgi:gas vesicle protein